MNTKIINFDEIKSLPKEAVVAYGHFTTIHAGHIRYLRHAKKIGNELIVALLGDQDIRVDLYQINNYKMERNIYLLLRLNV